MHGVTSASSSSPGNRPVRTGKSLCCVMSSFIFLCCKYPSCPPARLPACLPAVLPLDELGPLRRILDTEITRYRHDAAVHVLLVYTRRRGRREKKKAAAVFVSLFHGGNVLWLRKVDVLFPVAGWTIAAGPVPPQGFQSLKKKKKTCKIPSQPLLALESREETGVK